MGQPSELPFDIEQQTMPRQEPYPNVEQWSAKTEVNWCEQKWSHKWQCEINKKITVEGSLAFIFIGIFFVLVIKFRKQIRDFIKFTIKIINSD